MENISNVLLIVDLDNVPADERDHQRSSPWQKAAPAPQLSRRQNQSAREDTRLLANNTQSYDQDGPSCCGLS